MRMSNPRIVLIVKNVVDEHGAKISVTSSEDVTTFKVSFNDPILLG